MGNLDHVFGKLEIELVAEQIVTVCREAGTWNRCFQIPSLPASHIGMTHLIYLQYLRPVPGISMFWIVTQEFVDKVATHLDLGSLPRALPECHGVYGVYPEPAHPLLPTLLTK